MKKFLAMLLAAMLVLSMGVVAFAEETVVMTDCGHFAVEWAGTAGAFSAGWKYSNPSMVDNVNSIKVGAKDAYGRVVVEYTADEEQVAWQQANGYVTAEGLSSAPFYKEYNSNPIAEGRDDDWTVVKGDGFDRWQPTLFYVEVKMNDGTVYSDEMVYNYDYPVADVQMTDCGHFTGVDWAGEAGAFSMGWKYSNFTYSEIVSVRVGAKDAHNRVVVEYTADTDQVDWQKANGYITAEGLSSAPFYKEYNGTPIAEGRDDDWTVAKGAGFDSWQPTLFYVDVEVRGGIHYYREMQYDYDYPCLHEFTEIRNQKEPTRTENGYTGDKYCSDCGTLLETGRTISKLPARDTATIVVGGEKKEESKPVEENPNTGAPVLAPVFAVLVAAGAVAVKIK
ncbi:MAG: hypothetical protein ACI4IT_06520 [Oscillospiraceae bacterium]